MQQVFPIFPILFVVAAVIVIGINFSIAAAAFRQRSAESNAPEESVPAQIVSRRTARSRVYAAHYLVTFELHDRSRIELAVPAEEYDLLTEGSSGLLKHQGTRYRGFERTERGTS